MEFGQSTREDEFQMNSELISVNNGGYGAVPIQIIQAQRSLMDEMERCPDVWFQLRVPALLKENTQAAAQFLGAQSRDTVLVPNATAGTNTILKSIGYEKGAAILYTNLTYNAAKNQCKHVAKTYIEDGEALEMEIRFPIEDEDNLVEQFDRFISGHPNIKIALIDHITSPTAVLMPVMKIAATCHARGVLVLVDGAHVPGQLPVDIPSLGVDFYTGNLHKWCFCPRSCAVLWVDSKFHDDIKPLITSHCYETGSLSDEFSYEGTVNYTAYCCAKKAIEYHTDLGGFEVLNGYNKTLLKSAVDHLVEKWGTGTLQITDSIVAPFIRLVRLPPIPGCTCEEADWRKLMLVLYEKYDVVSYCFDVQGALYIRLSCQIYNTMADYEHVGNAICDIAQNGLE